MTSRAAACVAAAALFAAACGTEQQQADTATPPAATAEALSPEVALAVAVARGIETNPAAADSILTANGLTMTGLDALMYLIAADSALTAAYTNAIK